MNGCVRPIYILSPGSCPRDGTSGAGDQKFNSSKHDHVAYQIGGNDE